MDLLEGVLSDEITAEQSNVQLDNSYNQWLSFILLQYKTCHRNDTQFWVDHKNVKFDIFDKMYSEIINGEHFFKDKRLVREPNMYYITIAGKGIKWKVDTSELPKKVSSVNQSIDHYTYFKGLHELFGT